MEAVDEKWMGVEVSEDGAVRAANQDRDKAGVFNFLQQSDAEVLGLVEAKTMRVATVLSLLMDKGYSSWEVSAALGRLHDAGILRLDLRGDVSLVRRPAASA